MSTTELDTYFKAALEVVDKAGTLVRNAFKQPVCHVKTKSSAIDLVTETDKGAEQIIIQGLSEKFPDHKFIGEESAGKSYTFTDAPTWIIDPIDGTTNFVHRLPMIGICVGLAIGRRMVAGIVYNPITNELWSAREGQGALKNGFPIHVSNTDSLDKALLSSTMGIHNIMQKGESWLDITLEHQRRMCLAGIHGHRSFGSAAINMVYIAQGSTDAYVEYGLHCWDFAAASLIVTEAGGALMDPTGSEFNLMHRNVLCAGTEKLARELSALLSKSHRLEFEHECEE